MRLFMTMIAAALATGSAAADTVFDVNHANAAGEQVDASQIKVSGDKLAMEMITAGDENAPEGRMIFRGDRNPEEMIVLNDAEQTYMVFTAQGVQTGMNDFQSQIQDQMAAVIANLPPEQQAAAQAMMNQQGGAGSMPGMPQVSQYSIQATGQTRTVNGLSTTGYELLENGVRTNMFWTVSPGAINGGDELANAFDQLQGFFEAMPMIGDSVGPIYDRSAMDGRVPIQIEEFDNAGDIEMVTTISPGQSTTHPASIFEPDAGYAQQDMFGGMPQ